MADDTEAKETALGLSAASQIEEEEEDPEDEARVLGQFFGEKPDPKESARMVFVHPSPCQASKRGLELEIERESRSRASRPRTGTTAKFDQAVSVLIQNEAEYLNQLQLIHVELVRPCSDIVSPTEVSQSLTPS